MFDKTKIIHILNHSPGKSAYDAKPEDANTTLGSNHPDDYKYYERINQATIKSSKVCRSLS